MELFAKIFNIKVNLINKNNMIVVTGAEGFIGSCLVAKLNQYNYNDLVLVDDFDSWPERAKNLNNKKYTEKVERKDFFNWFEKNANQVQFVFHIGARTDTTETNEAIFKELNLDFSKKIWAICVNEGIAMVYASSAATYGEGENGYDDDILKLDNLTPLNLYGKSKNDFDKWAINEEKKQIEDKIKKLLKNYQGISANLQKELLQLGFSIEQAGKHHAHGYNAHGVNCA